MRELILRWAKRFIELPTIGIDISDRSLKYVKLTRRGGFSIAPDEFAEIEIPERVMVGGEIKNVDTLADILKGLCQKEKKLCRNFATVSLPEEKSYLRVIQIPKVGPAEVANAVRWEIESNVPLPLEDLIYDFEVVESPDTPPDHMDIMITAYPKDIIESYVGVFEKAGIGIYAFELECQAIVRATVPESKRNEGVILLDIGRMRSSITVFSGRAILFTTTLDVGGKGFEGSIAKSLAVNLADALRVKIDMGLSRKKADEKVFEALKPAMDLLVNEMKRSIAYYNDHAVHLHGASREIGSVVLTGGDSNLLGLDTYLSSILKVPVSLGNPFVSLKYLFPGRVPPIPRNKSLAFSPAVGLAMRGPVTNQ